MRTLIIKTSSMGDVLHTLPALTDAQRALPEIKFDWVVEESFAQIPSWHPAVDTVIPVAMRKWRTQPTNWFGREVRQRLGTLRSRRYAHIIDAQGLLKSAVIARLARGARYHGYSFECARESSSALAYSHRISVPPRLHAIRRIRLLFAGALGYDCPTGEAEYGVDVSRFRPSSEPAERSLLFIHAATWQSKLWPEPYWHQLIELADEQGYQVLLPWGSDSENKQAQRLCSGHTNARVLPELGLGGLASVIGSASAAVSVDTGPGHLAAVLSTPCVSIYGATDPALTGTRGPGQHQLRADFECSPCLRRRCTYTKPSSVEPACYATVSPDQVWVKLLPNLLTGKDKH